MFQYKFIELKEKGLAQKLWNGSDSESKMFQEMAKSLLDLRSIQQTSQTLQHFLFLLLVTRQQKISSAKLTPSFFILSPYSLFSSSGQNELKWQQDGKEFISDSFNLAFFDSNMLSLRPNYIFGFDKFFFQNFPEFYLQKLTDKMTDFRFIIKLKKKMDDLSIKRAFLPLRLQLTNTILKAEKLTEFDALFLLNSIPPAATILKGMSIQFVKSWYAINFSAPLSVNTTIEVNYDLLENSSIANFLTLRMFSMYVLNFEGKTFRSKVLRLVGGIGYPFFNAFSSPPELYNFDHTVIHLENRFKQIVAEGKHIYLRVLYPIYLIVCIFGVWYFSLTMNVQCGNGMTIYTYLVYAIFGIITFLLEAFIFNTVLKYVSHLIPEMKPVCRVNFPNPIINKVKIFIMDIEFINRWYVNYVISFMFSQLSRFDFLTNIGFLYTVYSCGDNLIFLLALISISATTMVNISFYIMNFLGEKTYDRLITGQIDKIYQICSLLEFQAVAEMLDIISPNNSVIIFGKMFNQRIFNNFLRIIVHDMPLIIIKTAFLMRQSTGGSVFYPIFSSSLMLLSSFSKFLSINPSRLGQEDFNQLEERKRKRVLPKYLKKLSQFESQMTRYNQVEDLKCLKSTQYLSDLLESQNSSQKKEQIGLIEELRNFDSTTQSINDLFGNLNYNDISHVEPPIPTNKENPQENQKKDQLNKQEIEQINKQIILNEVSIKSNKNNTTSQTNLQLQHLNSSSSKSLFIEKQISGEQEALIQKKEEAPGQTTDRNEQKEKSK